MNCVILINVIRTEALVCEARTFCLELKIFPSVFLFVKKCSWSGKKRRHKEQWQLWKRWTVVFGYPCADHCGGQWRQLRSHSNLQANVRDTEGHNLSLYQTRAIFSLSYLKKRVRIHASQSDLWRIISLSPIAGQATALHVILYVQHLSRCFNRFQSIQNTQVKMLIQNIFLSILNWNKDMWNCP